MLSAWVKKVVYDEKARPDVDAAIGAVHASTVISSVHAYVGRPLLARWQFVKAIARRDCVSSSSARQPVSSFESAASQHGEEAASRLRSSSCSRPAAARRSSDASS